MGKVRTRIVTVLDILIVVFTVIGTCLMFSNNDNGAGLMSSGLDNFKYFTVLSNIFCGIVSLIALISRKMPVSIRLMTSSAVGLTFIIVAAFLQPVYPDTNLYQGGNLWFHLIVPVISMVQFVLLKTSEKIPFKFTFFSALLSLVYGIGYLINILINGVGKWPDTNDWYGFLNWGFPIGIAIFAVVVVINFVIAVILRALNGLVSKIRVL